MQLYDLNGSRLQRTSDYGDAAWASALARCHPSRFAAAPCCGRIRTSATDVFVKDYQHHFWVQTLCWQNYRNEILGHQGDCRKPRTGRSRLLTQLLCGRPSSPRYREQSLPSSPAETDSGTGAKAAQLCSTPGSRASLVAGRDALPIFIIFIFFTGERACCSASEQAEASWLAGPCPRTANAHSSTGSTSGGACPTFASTPLFAACVQGTRSGAGLLLPLQIPIRRLTRLLWAGHTSLVKFGRVVFGKSYTTGRL